MADWSDGYVAEIDYTFGYYQELNPLRISLAFLQAGLVAPEVGNACELGFGQGISANIHAAASVSQWSGTDFNPAQAVFAKELSHISGSNAQFYDDAFADYCNRPDLPDFDYIGLHGIWSWISDDNRAIIVDFIRRKLKVGGVLYISYNTMPGWASLVPLRNLLAEHSEVLSANGTGIVPRINNAIEFAEQLLEVNPAYARANLQIAERLKKIKEQNRNYLAHEYFNRDWLPMSFSDMGQWLAPTKLSYACSAHYPDFIDGFNLTNEQQAFLKNIPDPGFKETVRDFIINQQFRRDYWVKGPRKLPILEQSESLRLIRLVLLTPRADITLTVNGSLGQVNLSETVYNPILDVLANYEIKTLGQIEQAIKPHNISFQQLVQAIIVMAGAARLSTAQDDKAIAQSRKKTDKLNKHLFQKAISSGDIPYISSPVTGGGIALSRFQQLFLLSLLQGKKQPVEWAQFVWQILDNQGQKIVKDGNVLETAELNLAELESQAQVFAEKQLPLMKALQVV